MLRRLQEDAAISLTATGAFIHAAPLDASGTMLDTWTTAKPYPEPWHILLLGKSLEAYTNSVPAFNASIQSGFRPYYDALGSHHGRWDAAQLRELWSSNNASAPLDVFDPLYRESLRTPLSAARAQWARVLAAESDMILGWTPAVPVHLCTGGADSIVPSAITRGAAAAWGAEVTVFDGLEHTPGVAKCLLLSLGRLTSNALPHIALPEQSDTSSPPPVTGMDLSPALLSWNRISTAVVILATVVVGWALLTSFSRATRTRSSSTRVECGPGAGSRGVCGCTERALITLLSWPISIMLLALVIVGAPTGWQLIRSAQSLFTGDELFDLEIASLRAVTGRLTDREDAYFLLSQPNLSLQLSGHFQPALSSAAPLLTAPMLPPSPQSRHLRSIGSSRARQLQGTRWVTIYFSEHGGRREGAVVGNVLLPSALRQIRSIEGGIISAIGSQLSSLETVVPCLFGALDMPAPHIAPAGMARLIRPVHILDVKAIPLAIGRCFSP